MVTLKKEKKKNGKCIHCTHAQKKKYIRTGPPRRPPSLTFFCRPSVGKLNSPCDRPTFNNMNMPNSVRRAGEPASYLPPQCINTPNEEIIMSFAGRKKKREGGCNRNFHFHRTPKREKPFPRCMLMVGLLFFPSTVLVLVLVLGLLS